MAHVRISLVTVGHMPPGLHLDVVRNWRSSLFELMRAVPSYALTRQSDGPDWSFSDAAINSDVPPLGDADFLVALVNVPLEDNYYVRRLRGNRIVMTFHEVHDIMLAADIPLENAVLRTLYASALLYRRVGNAIPATNELSHYTHDETRGCLFDMNGIKTGLVKSCSRPIVCTECSIALQNMHVATSLVTAVQRELRGIRKPLYFRLLDAVKAHPVLALTISSAAAIVLGALGSLLAALLYDRLR